MDFTCFTRPFSRSSRLIGALLITGLAFVVHPAPTTAAGPFIVKFATDMVDIAPGDGHCDASPALGDQCTLRAAIMEANKLPGADTIELAATTYTLSRAGDVEDAGLTGDLDILGSLTINGTGPSTTVVDAAELDRVFHIHLAGSTVQISGVTLQNGQAYDGGGVYTRGKLSLSNSMIRNNTVASYGGGVYGDESSILTLTNSTVSGNIASGGGGIANKNILNLTNSDVSGNSAIFGGGVFNTNTAVLTSSTVSGNTANKNGGGINTSGPGTLTLLNGTISGNSAKASGGGIHQFAGTLHLNNATIVGNSAGDNWDGSGAGAGGGLHLDGAAYIKNSIVAGNSDVGNQGLDCIGSVHSQGYNILQSMQGCKIAGDITGNKLGVNPRLDALKFNGGRTKTHAPLGESPAVDQGSTTTVAYCTTNDQRGIARPNDDNHDGTARCDIGAVEYEGPHIDSLNPTSKPVSSAKFTLVVNGHNFTNTSKVLWKGQPRTTTFVSATKLKALVTAADLAVAGNANLRVVTTGVVANNGTSNPKVFTITTP
jgi:hypothetical protein